LQVNLQVKLSGCCGALFSWVCSKAKTLSSPIHQDQTGCG